MSSRIKLSELPQGASAVVFSLENGRAVNDRLAELGFYPGADVKALFSAVFGDPRAYLVQDAVIALRRSESEKIFVSIN